MKLVATSALNSGPSAKNTIELANDIDPRTLNLEGVERIDLTFPKFTDGRAFSQAFLLRRRLGFKCQIRATGDVLIDQLVQMHRSGFDAAVLRDDQDLGVAQRQFERYQSFYQGDAMTPNPHFNKRPAPKKSAVQPHHPGTTA